MNSNDVLNARVRRSEDLCKLVEDLDMGYHGFPQQLQCNNGAFVSSLLNFFDDNPGAMETLQSWIADNLTDEDEESDEEDYECEEDC